jgi:hypothetical protein
MPKRPRRHQLETESSRVFAASLPPAWIYRAVNPDYGLDGLVEIFTPSGRSTGEFFFVQLKATDQTGGPKSLRVVLPLHTYEYYHALLLPVLLVLFHAPTRCLYSRWIPDPSSRSRIFLSRTRAVISFDSADIWSKARFTMVRRRLKHVKKATLLGERDARIDRYYALREKMKLWAKARGIARPFPRFAKGNRVLHPVFGRGTVDQASHDYMFVQFDDDRMLRKFIPGQFPEFTVVADRRDHRRRPRRTPEN